MLQTCCGLDLPQEALWPQHMGQLGVEDLEGDRPVVAEIVREVNGGHAALPELALDDVPAAKSGAQSVCGASQVLFAEC
jgi:hypothetical protein